MSENHEDFNADLERVWNNFTKTYSEETQVIFMTHEGPAGSSTTMESDFDD